MGLAIYGHFPSTSLVLGGYLKANRGQPLPSPGKKWSVQGVKLKNEATQGFGGGVSYE